MQTGDIVEVTNLNGETSEGRVIEVTTETVAERDAPFLPMEGAVLLDYWRGQGVDPDAVVVVVELGSGVYDYPADRVEVLADAE